MSQFPFNGPWTKLATTSEQLQVLVTSRLAADVQAISTQWLHELNLPALISEHLTPLEALDVGVDLVALGKASREMAAAVHSILGSQVRRRLLVCDVESASLSPQDPDVRVGEHPIPGDGSLAAARELVEFLDAPSEADVTLFLLSGGASSLCSLPEPPLDLGDMREIWHAALATGIDITALNKLRAATSQIAGGSILRHVHTAGSRSLIMVDNVLSGAEWVASGLTYEYTPPRSEVESLVERIGLTNTGLGNKILAAFDSRSSAMALPVHDVHANAVVADPEVLLDEAVREAGRRGYRVVDMGSHISGDVHDVCDEWAHVLARVSRLDGRYCVVGVGEVTVQVRGNGLGGRCQEFAWSMAGVLEHLGRDAAFAARSSDGRDFLRGVAGAWVDATTKRRAQALGMDWLHLKRENDSYRGLLAVDQLLAGGHTGWNLCDLYVAVL